MNPEVAAHVKQILSQKHIWNYIFNNRDSLNPIAVKIVSVRCCTAGEIKNELAGIPDEYLDLLEGPTFRSSAVKSKALDVRLRRRAKGAA